MLTVPVLSSTNSDQRVADIDVHLSLDDFGKLETEQVQVLRVSILL